MDLELLTYVCAGFTLIALVGSSLAILYRYQSRARSQNAATAELARQLGLDQQDRVMAGRIGEVELRAAPSRVVVRSGGSSRRAQIPAQEVAVGCYEGEHWVLLKRSEVGRVLDPALPSLDQHLETGHPELDEKYLLAATGEPAFAFWQDPHIRKCLLELDLVVAVAAAGKLRAWYRPQGLTKAFSDVERLERALYTTVAMTSESLLLLHRPHLEGPLPPVQLFDPVKWSALAGVAGGAITSHLWRRPEWEIWDGPGQTWQGLALGFTFAFVPVVLLLLLTKALRAKAGRGPAKGGESPGAPYR